MLRRLRQLPRTAWNSPTLTTWLSLLTRTLGGVAVMPIVLRRFDPAEVAVWYLFATIMGIGVLLDLGINSTLARFVAYAHAENDEVGGAPGDQTQAHIGTLYVAMRRLYAAIAIVAMVLMAVIGTWVLSAPIGRLDSPSTAHGLWILILLLSPLAFTNNLHLAFLQGSGFIAVVRRWDAIFGLLGILSNLIVLECGLGLAGLVISSQFWIVVTAWRTHRIFASRLGKLVRVERVAREDARLAVSKILSSSWRVGLGSLAYMGAQQSSGLIYGMFGPKDKVASYLLGLQVLINPAFIY